MSAPLLKPKKRIRVERHEHRASISDEGHSWAVSYADFLMVLLSFFIIFFSIDAKKREELIDNIKTEEKGVTTSASESPGGPNLAQIVQGELPKGLSEKVEGTKGLFIDRGTKQRSLMISFEDNLYQPGRIDMPADQVAKLVEILDKLRPFQTLINITFIGHTDSQAVTRSRSRYLQDNFALSSLRASTALQYAAKAGMDPSRMYTKGAAENSRGTRTLSVLVTPREVEQ
jgi:flagellar motor protein MotB